MRVSLCSVPGPRSNTDVSCLPPCIFLHLCQCIRRYRKTFVTCLSFVLRTVTFIACWKINNRWISLYRDLWNPPLAESSLYVLAAGRITDLACEASHAENSAKCYCELSQISHTDRLPWHTSKLVQDERWRHVFMNVISQGNFILHSKHVCECNCFNYLLSLLFIIPWGKTFSPLANCNILFLMLNFCAIHMTQDSVCLIPCHGPMTSVTKPCVYSFLVSVSRLNVRQFLGRWTSVFFHPQESSERSPVTSQLLSKTSWDSPSFDPVEAPLNAAVERGPEGLHPQMIKKWIIGLFIMLLKPKVHY